MGKIVGAILNCKKCELNSFETENGTDYCWNSGLYVPYKRLQLAIESKKWNTKEASEKCGIEYKLFKKYVSGEKEIPLTIIDQIADAFKIPVNFFIAEDFYYTGGII